MRLAEAGTALTVEVARRGGEGEEHEGEEEEEVSTHTIIIEERIVCIYSALELCINDSSVMYKYLLSFKYCIQTA